jgi:methionine synthase II (cobalamin-independent)
LRAAGVIPLGVKFQVSLPLTESATRAFLTNAHDFALLWSAYEEALGREITRIVEAIPADDLVIQWDVCVEVLALELQDRFGGSWQPTGDPFERYLQALTALAKHVPDQTLMGCHLCYGDLGHHHLVEPADLRLLVRMANAARTAVTRRIDYYHLPVPRNRDDAAYFAPLQDLNIGEAKLYLGLIHHTDGVEGALRRVRTARQSASGFGVATECGFGRRPPETIPQLLRIHREVAAAL